MWYDEIKEHYEKGSVLITSNRALSVWPDLLLDPLLASAGLDRLLDRAEVIIILGPSFRSQGRTKLLEEGQAQHSRPNLKFLSPLCFCIRSPGGALLPKSLAHGCLKEMAQSRP